jgi:hypothetical protein
MIIDRLPLARHCGLYVADFGESVKIGRSVSMNYRIAQHFDAGATRAWVSSPVLDVVAAERDALYLAGYRGTRKGTSEWFTGITFDDGIEIVVEAIAWTDRPVVEDLALVDLDALTTWTPVKRYKVKNGERWLGRNEAAAYLGISTRAFDRLIADRWSGIHKYAPVNRRVVFDLQELERYRSRT